MTARDPIDVWLLRHGEIGSYEGDHGLTERGARQARDAARALREALTGSADGHADPEPEAPVRPLVLALRHATSARATETAHHLGAALAERDVVVDGPRADPGFDNLAVAIDGHARPHDELRAAVARHRREHGPPPPGAPDWLREGDRFAYIHDGGGDPIQWWLTQPCLAYEPPSRVVRRFWRALVALGAELTGHDRASGDRIEDDRPAPVGVAVCTHSGPIRALAAEAIGRDLGEPAHLEALHVHLAADRSTATLGYRGETVTLAVPGLQEPDWP